MTRRGRHLHVQGSQGVHETFVPRPPCAQASPVLGPGGELETTNVISLLIARACMQITNGKSPAKSVPSPLSQETSPSRVGGGERHRIINGKSPASQNSLSQETSPSRAGGRGEQHGKGWFTQSLMVLSALHPTPPPNLYFEKQTKNLLHAAKPTQKKRISRRESILRYKTEKPSAIPRLHAFSSPDPARNTDV